MRLLPLSILFSVAAAAANTCIRQCIVKSGGSNLTDNAPHIVQAFKECGRGGSGRLRTNYLFCQ